MPIDRVTILTFGDGRLPKKTVALTFIAILGVGIFLGLKDTTVTKATSGAYVYDDSNFIYLGNDFLEIQFSRKEKGAIYSFLNKLTGHEYVTEKNKYNAIWKLQVTMPTNLSSVDWFDPSSYRDFTFSWSSASDYSILSMMYSDSEKPYKMNVTATVCIFQNSSLTRWRVRVDNGEPNWAIESVWFPILAGFQRLDDSGDDYVLMPDGKMISDPYVNIIGAHRPGEGGLYPTPGYGIQLMLVGDTRGGLYCATYDAECYAKTFHADNDGTNIVLSVEHLNTLLGGQNYEMHYDTIFGVFEGGYWKTLCLYREWATKQWWASNGTVSERQLPEWFKQGFAMTIITSYYGNFDANGTWIGLGKNIGFGDVPKKVDEYCETLRAPILLRWLGWEKYGAWVSPDCLPPAESELVLRNAIQELHSLGYFVVFGLSAGIWDTCLEDYNTTGRFCTLSDRDGRLRIWHDGSREVASVSQASEIWRQILINNVLRLVEMGADGVQLDAWLHVPADYGNVYSHPLGYGNWYTKEVLKTLGQIRTKTRLINPYFVIASEGIAEPFLPYIDLPISTHIDYLSNLKDQYGKDITILPVFNFIYRGYMVPFGRELLGYSNMMQETTSSYGPVFLDYISAFSIIAGIVPEVGDWSYPTPAQVVGMVSNSTFSLGAFPADLYDTMLEFMPSESPRIVVGDMSLPSLLSSVWKSHSEDLCFIFANIGDNSYTTQLHVNLNSYGIENGNYSIFCATSTSFEFLFPKDAALPVTLNLTIFPKSVLLLDVCNADESQSLRTRWEAAVGSFVYLSVLPQARSRGIPVGAIEVSFREARNQVRLQNYQNSLVCAKGALSSMADILKRFSFVLNDTGSFESLINETETLSEGGRFFEAATEAFQASEMILGNLKIPIFFDDLHTDRDYFSTFRYDIFKSHFESIGYKVVMSQTVPLSWNELNGTRTAVFWAPSLGFTTNETNMILQYVIEGNNLVLLLDAWLPSQINMLTTLLGVKISPGAVIAKNHLWDEGSFPVSDFRAHPITEGISYTEANWIAPMKTLGNATPLAYTSNDTWTSEDLKIVGPFAYMTVSNYGLGKVLIIADNLFMEVESHLKMLHNGMSWFTGDYWLAYLSDLNRDSMVNILDITIVAKAFSSKPESPNWNEVADLDKSGVIDIMDIAMVAKYFGKTV